MPAKRNLKPQVPGVEPSLDQMPPQEGEVDESPTVEESPQVPGVEPDAEEETITVTRSQLEDMVAGMVDSRVVAEVKAARRRTELSPKINDDAHLPDQSEVDANKITRAILTKQGYVCPRVHESDRIRMQAGASLPK